MSIGRQLLTSIVQGGSRGPVRALRPELFEPDERPTFEFFMHFYRQYAGLPTMQIMAEAGYALPPSLQPTAYLFDRATNRAIYNSVQANLQDFQTALRTQNGEALRAVVGDMNRLIQAHAAADDAISLTEAAVLVMQGYAEAHAGGAEGQGITMGWEGLDVLTGGAQPGEVVTWVARPNVGKSYTLARVASEAWRDGHSVLFVSMEMQTVSMARRIIGVMAGTNPDFIKRGTLSMWGEEHVYETIQQIEHGPPFTMVAGNLSKTVGVVDAYVQEYSPDLIVIDAQYLMKPSNQKGNAKQWESLSEVGIEVQQMALSRNRAVHQSVQFGRAQGKGEAGDLAKIGGTDVVGQISTHVIAIREADAPNERTRRVLELIKNRDGALGSITTNFMFEPLNFDELPPDMAGADAPLDPSWML